MPAPRGPRAVKRKASSVSVASKPKKSRPETAVNGHSEKVSHRSHRSVVGHTLTVGSGDTGQLGLGEDVMERTKPGLVKLDPNLVQVAAGGMHTVCLSKDGKVFTFGCNDEGALGRKTEEEEDCFEPGSVDLDECIVQISAGDSHTAALTENGDVYAWGTFRDANGPIGLREVREKSEVPVKLLSGQHVAKISSGNDHMLCLTTDGQIFSMGCAEQGQLGRVAECFSTRGGRKGLGLLLTPAIVHCKSRKAKFCDVWTGAWSSFAKTDNGDIYTWGLNNYYQIGFPDMVNRFVPDRCSAFKKDCDWQEIAGGQHHSLALDKDGKVYSIGRKEYGRLGLGEDVAETKAPTQITSLEGSKCLSIGCGSSVSFAVADDGAVFAWGMGSSQQLGQSEDDDLYVPTKIVSKQMETRDGVMVSAGGQHTVILAKDRT